MERKTGKTLLLESSAAVRVPEGRVSCERGAAWISWKGTDLVLEAGMSADVPRGAVGQSFGGRAVLAVEATASRDPGFPCARERAESPSRAPRLPRGARAEAR